MAGWRTVGVGGVLLAAGVAAALAGGMGSGESAPAGPRADALAQAGGEQITPGQAELAQPGEQPVGEAEVDEEQVLVRVATIDGIEANQQFRQNVQLVQSQRQRVIELTSQIEQMSPGDQRQQLEAERDTVLEQLNRNNQQMVEAYGFSITRNYVQVIETSHIYVAVTEDEAERYRQLRDAEESD